MKRTINFLVNGLRVSLKFEIDPKLNPGRPHTSLTGTFDGGGGQIDGRLRVAGADFPEVQAICDLWDQHHLKKPTKAGTAAINAALDALDGQRLGHAPDLDEVEEISESSDIIDSRDVIKRIEAVADALRAHGIDPDTYNEETSEEPTENAVGILDEYLALKKLEEQGENCGGGDWPYGVTLVRESYFQEYAEDTASDIGSIDRNARWPNNHIDWEAAAEELKQDYTEVTFRGVTYWAR